MSDSSPGPRPIAGRILDKAGLAQMLLCSERQIDQLRATDPEFPRPRMLGRLPRWAEDAVYAYILSGSAPGSEDDPDAAEPVPPPNRRRGGSRERRATDV